MPILWVVPVLLGLPVLLTLPMEFCLFVSQECLLSLPNGTEVLFFQTTCVKYIIMVNKIKHVRKNFNVHFLRQAMSPTYVHQLCGSPVVKSCKKEKVN